MFNYSRAQIDAAKAMLDKMNAGDSHALQADDAFKNTQAILLLKENGEIPLSDGIGQAEPVVNTDDMIANISQNTNDISEQLMANTSLIADESGLPDFDASSINKQKLKGPIGVPGIDHETGEITADFPVSTAFQKPLSPRAQSYLDGTIEPITPITLGPNDGSARASGEPTYTYKYRGEDHISARDKYQNQYEALNFGDKPDVFAPASVLNETSYFTGLPTVKAQSAQKRNDEITRLRGMPNRNVVQEQRLADLEHQGMRNQIGPLEHAVNKVSKPWSQNAADVVAGQGLNHLANNSVDQSRMHRLNYYKDHSYTEALNQFPHSSPNQFKAMHDFYSNDPSRKQAMINRATSPNLGEEETAYAAEKYADIAKNDPISPRYNDDRLLNLPGKVSQMVADQAYTVPTAAVTGRGVDANKEALNMAAEYEVLGETPQQAAQKARDFQFRNPSNYVEMASINPAGTMRKAAWGRVKNTAPVNAAMTAVENSKIAKRLGNTIDSNSSVLNKLTTKTIDNAVNYQIKNKINNMHRDLSGLPPELKEQAIMDLLEKSALGVLDDSIKTGIRGY